MNPHDITKSFEQALAEYTGAPFVVCTDNCSNAIYLSLMFVGVIDRSVTIPQHTYPSLPQEIKRAGGWAEFSESPKLLTGEYKLIGTCVWDSALRFTADMYRPGQLQCLSFSGPYKHIKLGKGGAILTDDEYAYKWLKKARFSGRSECSYHEDNFDDNPVLGINAYLLPELAARGLQLMQQFYNADGTKKHNEDLTLEYPDLSQFQLWK